MNIIFIVSSLDGSIPASIFDSLTSLFSLALEKRDVLGKLQPASKFGILFSVDGVDEFSSMHVVNVFIFFSIDSELLFGNDFFEKYCGTNGTGFTVVKRDLIDIGT